MAKVSNNNLKPGGIIIGVGNVNLDKQIPSEPKLEYKDQYFTLKALEKCKFTLSPKNGSFYDYTTGQYNFISEYIAYSIDNGKTWTLKQIYDSGDNPLIINTPYISKGKTILFKGDLKYLEGGLEIKSSGKFDAYGNVMSLIYEDNFKNKNDFPEFPGQTQELDGYVWTEYEIPLKRLFKNSTHLINAKNLILPVINLTYDRCYAEMFYGCTSLKTGPKLPATILSTRCYMSMFYNCISLITAPELPATTLTSSCYRSMFENCTALINTPKLSATISTTRCYYAMFSGCTSLKTITSLSLNTTSYQCCAWMFNGCISLINIPHSLPATILAKECYLAMFKECTSINTAPELPAATLVYDCYRSMFYNCSNLNYIKALFITSIDSPIYYCTESWVYNVAQNGTFIKNINANWNSTGVNVIPQGWTVETASE